MDVSGLPAHRPPSVVGLVSGKWEHPPPAQTEVDRPAIVHARRHAQHDVHLHRGITTADQRRMLAFPPRSRSCSDVEPPGESHSAFLPLCRIQGKRLIRRIKVQPSSSTATWFHHQCPSANYQKVLWFQGSTFSSCFSPRCQTTCPNSNPRPLSLICLGRFDRISAVLNKRLD